MQSEIILITINSRSDITKSNFFDRKIVLTIKINDLFRQLDFQLTISYVEMKSIQPSIGQSLKHLGKVGNRN